MSEAGRILVVEDNLANQLLASAVLERDGFSVDVAESAAAALRSPGEHMPDLNLMDIQLAGEDSLSFTRKLKAQPSTALIPVVALTAHAMLGQKQEAIAAGCSGYISKPIDTRTFVAQVKAFLAADPTQSESISYHSQEETEREHHQAP